MKKYILIAGIAVAVAGLASLAYAAERQTAVSDTNAALEIIQLGMDWDGQTPINEQQQSERMDANVSVLGDQQGQRNFSGGLGMALLVAGVGATIASRKIS